MLDALISTWSPVFSASLALQSPSNRMPLAEWWNNQMVTMKFIMKMAEVHIAMCKVPNFHPLDRCFFRKVPTMGVYVLTKEPTEDPIFGPPGPDSWWEKPPLMAVVVVLPSLGCSSVVELKE